MGLWKEIRKDDSLINNKFDLLGSNGKRVKFWRDIWCNGVVLCDTFPSLYVLALSKKEAWVAEVWNFSGEEGVGVLTSLHLLMIERWIWWSV